MKGLYTSASSLADPSEVARLECPMWRGAGAGDVTVSQCGWEDAQPADLRAPKSLARELGSCCRVIRWKAGLTGGPGLLLTSSAA